MVALQTSLKDVPFTRQGGSNQKKLSSWVRVVSLPRLYSNFEYSFLMSLVSLLEVLCESWKSLSHFKSTVLKYREKPSTVVCVCVCGSREGSVSGEF